MLLHDDRIEGGAQFIAVAGTGRPHRCDLLPSIGQGDLGLLQRLTCLQVILLGADSLLPQLLFPLKGQPRQFQATLSRLLLTAQVGDLLAGNHRQYLAALDRLAQLGVHRFDHTRHAGYHMSGAVLVKADLTREADGGAQLTGACGSQLYASRFDLRDRQVQLAFFFAVLLLCMAFDGLRCSMAVAVFTMVVMGGLSLGRLAEVAGPGQAREAKRSNGGSQKG
ncbi:hypothetical protein D3C78_1338530 [compost metagenome]